MPVLVVGAETAAGRATVRGLAHGGGEVRVWLDADRVDEAIERHYRRSGCKVAVGAMDDEGRLELALEQGHTVVHLDGGPLDDPVRALDAVAVVAAAAIGARCRRLVYASHLGADEPGGNAYLQACADAEDLLADAPLETVVVRRALTYGRGDPLTEALAAGPPARALQARHAPLFAEDLAGAVVAADRERHRPGDHHVVVELAGPDVVTVGQLARLLRPPTGGLWGVLGRAGSRAGVLPPATVDLLARDALPGPDALGRRGTPLTEGIRRMRASQEVGVDLGPGRRC